MCTQSPSRGRFDIYNMFKIKINANNYLIRSFLGKGGYGSVYLATRIDDDLPVVIKKMTFPIRRTRAINGAKYEIAILDWVTKILGDDSPFNRILDSQTGFTVTGEEFKAYIVLEHLQGDNLTKFWMMNKPIDRTRRHMMIKNILEQVLLAINILHEHDIVHRDLKGENIMVVQGAPMGYKIVIIDFGFACSINDTFLQTHPDLTEYSKSCPSEFLGTPEFVAPQLIEMRNKKRDLNHEDLKKADIWAIGILLFELIYAHIPIDARDIDELFSYISDYDHPDGNFQESMRQKYPTPFDEILDSIFVQKDARPTARQLISKVQQLVIEDTTN